MAYVRVQCPDCLEFRSTRGDVAKKIGLRCRACAAIVTWHENERRDKFFKAIQQNKDEHLGSSG